MIEIEINQEPIVLDEDTEFDLVRENPFFSNAGDYTFDIDVNLRKKGNASLYQFLHRHNSGLRVTGRAAVIRDGARRVCSGTESILQIEDSVAKIQILSDNSELNYLHSSKKIRELDLGTAAYTIESAGRDVNKIYPEVNFSFPLVYKTASEGYKVDNGDESFNRNFMSNDMASFSYVDIGNMIPQPFLMFYVYAIPQALGYQVIECCIDQRKYNKLLIIHGYKTNEFAKMLPDWTVSEFFDEIQKFFNCVFVFNSQEKTLRIISVDSFYREVGTEYIADEKVLDECNRKFDEDAPPFLFLYKNVGYKHATGNYWAFADMSDEVYERSEHINRSFRHAYMESYNSKDLQVFYDAEDDFEFIHFEGTDGSRYTRIVNQFRHVTEKGEYEKTELSIIPAEMISIIFNDDFGTHMFPAPVTSLYSEAMQSSFCEVVRNGLNDSASSIMEVAFYGGLRYYRDINGRPDTFHYGTTRCWTTKWMQNENVSWHQGMPPTGGSLTEEWDERDVLDLQGRYGKISTEFTNGVEMDADKLFIIKFISNDILDPRKKFLIKNRLFYCKQLKYHLSKSGVEKIVEGEFFPVK